MVIEMPSPRSVKPSAKPEPPGPESERSGSVADLIKTLNKEGFTEIFFPHSPSAQDSLLLGDGYWTKVEEDSELLRVGPSLLAFLRNPLTSDESAIRSNGSAIGWGSGGDWTQTSSKHKRVYRLSRQNTWDELHNRIDENISIEEQARIEAGEISDGAQPHAPLAPAPVLPEAREPETQTHKPRMVEDDRIITKQGGRYFPISLAADFAQAPRTTLLNWIKAKVKFQGRPLQIYNSPTARKAYLTEESVQRVANRFIKWPSKKSAGPVTIGETDDQSGYLGLPDAARTIGVDPHTMWLWATHGKAPTDKPLDVIKCTAPDQFYIREKDVSALKAFVPRSGLRRGRRPQVSSAQPPKILPHTLT